MPTKKSLRIKYVNQSSVRILGHFGRSTYSWSIGCPIFAGDVSAVIEDSQIPGGSTVKTELSLEAVMATYNIFTKLVPFEEKKDQYGRMVDTPIPGFDYMVKTNSSAKMTPMNREKLALPDDISIVPSVKEKPSL